MAIRQNLKKALNYKKTSTFAPGGRGGGGTRTTTRSIQVLNTTLSVSRSKGSASLSD